MGSETSTLVEKLLEIESEFRTKLSTLSKENFEEDAREYSFEIGTLFLTELFELIPAAQISLWARTIDAGTSGEKNILKPFLGQKFPDGEYYRHVTTVFHPKPHLFYVNYSSDSDIEATKRETILNNESILGWKGKIPGGFEDLMFNERHAPLTGYPNDWAKQGKKSLTDSTLIEYRKYVKSQFDIEQGRVELPFETAHSSVVFPIKDADRKTFYLLRFEGIKPPTSNPLPEELKDLMDLAMEYRGEFLRRLKERTAPLLTREAAEEYVKEKQKARLLPKDFELTEEFMRENAYRIIPYDTYKPHGDAVQKELAEELKQKHNREAFDGLPKPTEDEIQLLAQFFDYDEPVTKEQLRQLGYVAKVLEGIVNSYAEHDEIVRLYHALEAETERSLALQRELLQRSSQEQQIRIVNSYAHDINTPVDAAHKNLELLLGAEQVFDIGSEITQILPDDRKQQFYELLKATVEKPAMLALREVNANRVRIEDFLEQEYDSLARYASSFARNGYDEKAAEQFIQQYGEENAGRLIEIVDREAGRRRCLMQAGTSLEIALGFSHRLKQLSKRDVYFSLQEGVETAMHTLSADLMQHKIMPEFDYQPASEIHGDLASFCQVVVNIVDNARKALAETHNPELKIKTYEQDNYSVLEIGNNGPHIPADKMNAIFESRVSLTGSSGIGLTTVKDIVEKTYKGRLDVESAEGYTCFRAYFPHAATPSPQHAI